MNDKQLETDERFMRIANGDVPIGAVIVHKGQIVAKAYNQREQLQDPTAHAEIIALTQAATALGNWHLHDCTIYVTLEPCCMCAGALVLSRIDRLVYACVERLNHRLEITPGVLSNETSRLLQGFFQNKRKT
ncbi:MAG: nucleoside deaminase [Planctomycetota bacterium]|jgi:tRNA(adenine34) deaminase